jgi:hypothetical protein
MYIRGSRGSFAFSCRSPDHVAVVSFARMGLGAESEAAAAELLKVRLRKMITKDVAILSLGMDENYNPRSVLFHAINGLEDLDYAEENLSPFPAMLVSAGPEAEADGGLRFGLTREQRGWALAASALPTEMNGERHDLLGGVHLSPENILSAQRSLQDGWGVDSRGRLLEALEWLETEGHRKEFKRQGAYLSSLTRAQLKVLLDERAGDAEARARIAVVAEHYKRLGGAGLLGWDYSRYVSLCRSGYAAGYITEEEAWAKIIPAARALQTRFGSWKEVGENYLIGREFWAGGGAGQQCGRCREALRRLLADPQSPWRVYPFKTAPHEGGPS